MQLVIYGQNTFFLSVYQPMTEATGCCLAIISYDSYAWTTVCCSSYSFPLIVRSVFLGWTEGSHRLDWDVTGPLARLFGLCLLNTMTGCDVTHYQSPGSLGCGLLAFGVQWWLVTHKWRIYKELGLVQNQWSEFKGSDGLFWSIFRVSGYFSVNMLVMIQGTVCIVNFLTWILLNERRSRVLIWRLPCWICFFHWRFWE